MSWTTLILLSLAHGVVLSVILTLLIMGSLKINPEMWLQDFPPDVKAKWGPMSKKARMQRAVMAVLLFGVIIAVTVYTVWSMGRFAGRPPLFSEIFAGTTVIMLVFNLVDAVVIDWLFLTKLWPNFAVLPGTEGMPGYTDMKLQWRNFLKGCVFSPLFGLVAGGIAVLLMRL